MDLGGSGWIWMDLDAWMVSWIGGWQWHVRLRISLNCIRKLGDQLLANSSRILQILMNYNKFVQNLINSDQSENQHVPEIQGGPFSAGENVNANKPLEAWKMQWVL